jgi:isoleucyl-tRNA synthetase
MCRYWGTPIPIWMSEDGEETVCIGSVEELFQLSGVRVTDLHREFVDKVLSVIPTSNDLHFGPTPPPPPVSIL